MRHHRGLLLLSSASALAALSLLVVAAVWGPSRSAAASEPPALQGCPASPRSGLGWSNGVGGAKSSPHRFWLSDCYPTEAPADAQPWLAFDPRVPGEAPKYMRAVLDYFFEGNIQPTVEQSFDPRLNRVRAWYNAPWLDRTTNGREAAHGLTRERATCPGELGPRQNRTWDNYAVGFYNAPGGMALGRVWPADGPPQASAGEMPAGTVGAKLLFTTAIARQAPYLAGAPEWRTYVYDDENDPAFFAKPGGRRSLLPVRLLQVDIAVRDPRFDKTTGWVFGTFVYGLGGPPGGSGWRNLQPVGLMWGNRSDLSEQWTNPALHTHLGYPIAEGKHLLDGPVDNPRSSCISCHSTAETPDSDPLVPPDDSPASIVKYFGDVKAGEPFTKGLQPLDYSLQLSVGLHNYHNVGQPDPLLDPFCKTRGA